MNDTTNPSFFHKSVLVDETLEYLNLQPGKTYVDATFGSGGHSRAILEAEPSCKVIAVDWDRQSLDTYAPLLEQEFGDRFSYIWGNFAHLYKLLKQKKVAQVDGVLADFGTSQMHIMEREGFSFMIDTPLDMRMSPAHQKTTAAHVLNYATEDDLRTIFKEYGEERMANLFARAIVAHRKDKPFKTTIELAKLIKSVAPAAANKARIHPATRVFQALRIYVNRELDNIHAFLAGVVPLIATGGRLVCISFHSLEDRIVKQFFLEQSQRGALEVVTKQPVVGTDQEIRVNPSARSAKLRAAQKR